MLAKLLPVKFRSLQWLTPHPALPHGVSGAITLIIGGLITFQSLTGSYDLLYTPLIYIYVLSTFVNALSGYLTVHKSPKIGQDAFRRAAIFQMCCVYYVWRFSPLAIGLGYGVVRIFDFICAAGMILCLLSFTILALTFPNKVQAIAVATGTLALLALSGYPVQLALEGEEWWNCVQGEYPKQEIAFSGYVYVPTTWTFAMILFGVTLFQRQIISPAVFGYGFIASVLGSLFITVMTQELHVPVVSTQRLYIPCGGGPLSPMQESVVNALDTSAHAQKLLQIIRNATGWRLAPEWLNNEL